MELMPRVIGILLAQGGVVRTWETLRGRQGGGVLGPNNCGGQREYFIVSDFRGQTLGGRAKV